MKNVKFLLSAALVFLASAALAQDFSGPQYAKWGATPEEREQNILNSNFLKESCDNRDYDAAAHYLKGLIDKIPDAAESIYQRGAVVYKNKINRAKSVAEKNMFIDSLMLMYDMRAQYFGDNVKPGKTAFILDQKAREFLRYKPNDRKGIREAFRAAIAQAFQSKGDYTKAMKYLNEALAVETDPAERQLLLVRMALVGLVSNDIQGAASAARQARDLNPEDGVPYFVLAQCYGISAAHCEGFAGPATFWAAYDTMAKAVELLPSDSEYREPAKTSMNAFRSRFPTSEECFFNELQEGARYTVNCGTAAGVSTTVRPR